VSKVQRNETDVVNAHQAKEELAREPAPQRSTEEPAIADEICVEELAIDGICGVY
jgi:mycofactocin precursor